MKQTEILLLSGDNQAPLTTERSRTMRAVKGRNNASTELRMVRILKSKAITGWRRHQSLPGRPDFAFRAKRVALFVDGCFWHGCPRCYRAPKSRASYWSQKVEANRKRDKRANAQLRAAGWKVIRVWEHDMSRSHSVASRIGRMLR